MLIAIINIKAKMIKNNLQHTLFVLYSISMNKKWNQTCINFEKKISVRRLQIVK